MSHEVAEHIASLIDVKQVVPPITDGLLMVSFARAEHIPVSDRYTIGKQLRRFFGVPVILTEDEIDISLLTAEDLAKVGLVRAQDE